MDSKRYTPESSLPWAETRSFASCVRRLFGLLGKGMTIPQAARKIGTTEQTYYRWRKKYAGLRTDQAKRLKELEKENAQLDRRPHATVVPLSLTSHGP
jgi:transposase